MAKPVGARVSVYYVFWFFDVTQIKGLCTRKGDYPGKHRLVNFTRRCLFHWRQQLTVEIAEITDEGLTLTGVV